MLSNKLALITGSASGIGLSIAKTFADEKASVILVDIQENVSSKLSELKKENNQEHSSFVCDVSNHDQVQKLFKQIAEKYPSLKAPNVLVNCAGIAIVKPILELTEKEYDKVMNVNLKGAFLVTQTAVRALVENFDNQHLDEFATYASIINISGVLANYTVDNAFVYSASKSGMGRLTKSSAKEFAKYKIRVNSILPGFIDTPLLSGEDLKPTVEAFKEMTPLKRLGEPDEVAKLSLFLASDASSYITGSEIECSGGLYC